MEKKEKKTRMGTIRRQLQEALARAVIGKRLAVADGDGDMLSDFVVREVWFEEYEEVTLSDGAEERESLSLQEAIELADTGELCEERQSLMAVLTTRYTLTEEGAE